MAEKWMDALVKARPEKGLVLQKMPVPEPGPGEVLIKIHKTAICGTDVHIYDWNAWSQEHVKPPQIIGHEYVGEVAAMGAGVSGLYLGQRVSGEGHITCGRCRNCHNGNIQWCKDTNSVGVDRDGAFAEYLCIPQSNVIPMDPSLDEDVVAMFDAVGNATHTALMWNLVGEDVLITGAGPYRYHRRRHLQVRRGPAGGDHRPERLPAGAGQKDGGGRRRQHQAGGPARGDEAPAHRGGL